MKANFQDGPALCLKFGTVWLRLFGRHRTTRSTLESAQQRHSNRRSWGDVSRGLISWNHPCHSLESLSYSLKCTYLARSFTVHGFSVMATLRTRRTLSRRPPQRMRTQYLSMTWRLGPCLTQDCCFFFFRVVVAYSSMP